MYFYKKKRNAMSNFFKFSIDKNGEVKQFLINKNQIVALEELAVNETVIHLSPSMYNGTLPPELTIANSLEEVVKWLEI